MNEYYFEEKNPMLYTRYPLRIEYRIRTLVLTISFISFSLTPDPLPRNLPFVYPTDRQNHIKLLIGNSGKKSFKIKERCDHTKSRFNPEYSTLGIFPFRPGFIVFSFFFYFIRNFHASNLEIKRSSFVFYVQMSCFDSLRTRVLTEICWHEFSFTPPQGKTRAFSQKKFSLFSGFRRGVKFPMQIRIIRIE